MEASILQRKIAKLIQVEVSTILQREPKFSRGTMLTLSVVRVSRDLEHGKLYVSVFPNENAEQIISALNQDAWEIRKMMAARIKNQVRKIPNIVFHLDNTLQEAEKMEQLLASLDIPAESDDIESDSE
jgi:ribosome-binding factor A